MKKLSRFIFYIIFIISGNILYCQTLEYNLFLKSFSSKSSYSKELFKIVLPDQYNELKSFDFFQIQSFDTISSKEFIHITFKGHRNDTIFYIVTTGNRSDINNIEYMYPCEIVSNSIEPIYLSFIQAKIENDIFMIKRYNFDKIDIAEWESKNQMKFCFFCYIKESLVDTVVQKKIVNDPQLGRE